MTTTRSKQSRLTTALAALVAASLSVTSVLAPPAEAAADEVLHHNGFIEGPGFAAQDFGDDAYDAEAADDFVARRVWTITRVGVRGRLEPTRVGGVLAAVPPRIDHAIVRFYAADRRTGLPASEVPGSRRTVVPTILSGGSFDVVLANDPVTLDKGTYWLSVQTVHEDLEGQWFWSSVAGASGQPALWRNPGGGFGRHHCREWTSFDACFGPSLYDDLAWTLHGQSH